MNPLNSDASADGSNEAKPKIKRRLHTPAVVRAVRTKVISREEFESIISTTEMIAQLPDADGPADA